MHPGMKYTVLSALIIVMSSPKAVCGSRKELLMEDQTSQSVNPLGANRIGVIC